MEKKYCFHCPKCLSINQTTLETSNFIKQPKLIIEFAACNNCGVRFKALISIETEAVENNKEIEKQSLAS